jgi:tetratricopeptide (TPR) repeat protein
MNNQHANIPFTVTIATPSMLDSYKLRSLEIVRRGGVYSMLSVIMTLIILILPAAVAQQASSKYSDGVTIQGTVVSFDGKPVGDAVVRLEKKDSPGAIETKTNAAGAFAFSSLPPGSYRLSAGKSALRSHTTTVIAPSGESMEKVDLVLERPVLASDSDTSSVPVAQAMKFADEPNFTVAGVTDWTAVGGHGSDSTLRTSESLASETRTLKPESTGKGTPSARGGEEEESENKLRAVLASAPGNFEANHRLGKFYLGAGRYPEAIPLLEHAYRIDPSNDENRYDLALAYEGSGDLSRARGRVRELLASQQSADLSRLAGELDEKLDDPLSAVHEYEQAAKLNPSELNYFEWGSELLLHRAVWQAQEVFQKGADAYPKSARMQTALGAALFAGARYDEAALRLCDASDLHPADPNPYIFMGKILMAAPNSLACVEPKLQRFVQQQPESSIANYLYAVSILKNQDQLPDKQAMKEAEALLTKAVAIDSKCSEAYLQLGIISASQRYFDKAIGFYIKAIEADPQLADAHYRLGVAYDRTGHPAKAKEEFQLHDQIKQQQAEATERERREVKQFLIVQPGVSAGQAVK